MILVFKLLNDKINKLIRFIISEKIPVYDQRNQVVMSLNYMVAWVMLQLNFYANYARKENDPIPLWIKSTNPNITQEQMEEFLWNFDNMNRRSFLTNFLFQIEVLLESINNVLTNPTVDNGYKLLIKHIIKELKLKNSDNETFRKLYFPAMVRNALHMNGTHTENDDNGKIDGILFKFKKGNIVAYASWRHTYFFCDKILDVVEEILQNNYLKGKTVPFFHF